MWTKSLGRASAVSFFLFAGACGASAHDAGREATNDTTEPSSTAAVDVAPTTTSSAAPSNPSPTEPAPTTTAAAEIAPYPAEAIRRGQIDAQNHCLNLAYKKGCSELSAGDLSVRVTLRVDGTVISTHTVKNTIKNDPDVVEQCVLDAVSNFHFDAPGAQASSFTVRLAFDKC